MSAPSSREVTGVVLAGGESRRMGQNKALMQLGGERLVDRVMRTLGESCAELLMVTNSPAVYADVGLRMVGDVWPGKGSLGGIYSAIYHATTPYVLVVACDMPFLQAASLKYLIEQIGEHDVVMPDVLGEQQPLHAIYGRACLEPIRRRLEADRLKIVGFLPDVRVRTVTAAELQPFDPELLAFQNLNTPEEFEAAERHLQGL
ncbi:molybdenum cofactor guanylyltransferase [Candidatus Entotheonella palauensis]|uniref:molybdenum cofactor guanylyltransferase n=1 Tax=Candidatus Entotheonella palauensis TaxID=93172 RepID=UPI0004BA703E|nr:molybdenum cofactor guanylyltransferase [Candidatus Entotheonella palauensis]